ncbi:MAG: hypothetical protein FWC51_00050 [Proteobacteria bacterium]|nr:hypothetical protein [Pseudomonadota bacterium]
MTSKFDHSNTKIKNSMKRIRDVDRIFVAGNAEINSKSDLVKFVEEPCLAVCEDFYDKNILTYWASSNKKAPNNSYVCIRYESLDPANKAIADRLLKENKITISPYESGNSAGNKYGKGIYLGIPSDPDMLVSDVSKQLQKLASVFKRQDILYNMYTPEYLIGCHPFNAPTETFGFPDLQTTICGEQYTDAYQPHRERLFDEVHLLPKKQENGSFAVDMKEVAQKIGWIYHAENGNIYKNEETLRRHNAYENLKKKQKAKIRVSKKITPKVKPKQSSRSY